MVYMKHPPLKFFFKLPFNSFTTIGQLSYIYMLFVWCLLCVMGNETAAHIVQWILGLPSQMSARLQLSYENVFILQK